MIDISDKKALTDFLVQKRITPQGTDIAVKYYGGGVSGTVALASYEDKSLIVKQALEKLKVKENWFSDPKRMVIEKDGNEVYHRIVPENTPAVYFYDEENYIYGREAAPEHCTMWKSDLLAGLLDFRVAEKAILSLAKVHDAIARDEEIKAKFMDKSFFYDLRISPYIERVVQHYPELRQFAEPIIANLMESSITLVHGDYSPKNIMVDGSKIYILDFEVSHCGHPSFDLAFFSNHFLLKAVKNRAFADAYINMLRYMTGIYFNTISYMDATDLEADTIKLWALLFLARVDGKSPVEYIAEDADKDLIRKTAFGVIENNLTTYQDAIALLVNNIKD